jgi:uncharacterized protein DUF6221
MTANPPPDPQVQRLRDHLADVERLAEATGGPPWVAAVAGCVHVDPVAIADNRHGLGHLGFVARVAPGPVGEAYRAHIVQWNPARVLRLVAAHRQLLDRLALATAAPPSEFSSFTRGQDDGYRQACRDVLQDLLRVYDDSTAPGPES